MAHVVDRKEYQAWLAQMVAENIVPPEVRRIIVDIPIDGKASVYYECNADKRMFKINLAEMLDRGNPVIHVDDVAAPGAKEP